MKTRLTILLLFCLSALTSYAQDTTSRYRSTLSLYEREIVLVPRSGGGLLSYVVSRLGKSPLFVDTSQVYNWAEKFIGERQRAQLLLNQSLTSERTTSDGRYRRISDAIALNQIVGALDSIGKKANRAEVLALQQGGARDSSAYTKTQTNFLLGAKADASGTSNELARRATAATITQIRAWPGSLPTTFFVTDNGRAGNFVRDDTDNTSADDGVRVLVATGGVRYKRTGRDGLFVGAEYGLKGDATTDEVAVVQSLLASTAARSGKSTLTLDGKVYKFTQGITLNIARLKLIANGAVLDFSALSSGVAITITGAGGGASPYNQANTGIEGLELIGPGMGSSVTGIRFVTAAEGGTSHVSLTGLIVHSFGVGIETSTNSYIQNIHQAAIYGNGVGLLISPGDNSGERITVSQTTIFNNGTGVRSNNNVADTYLTDCSLDYNSKQVEVLDGRVFMRGHLEGKNYTQTPVTVAGNGSAFYFTAGWLLSTGNTTLPPYYFQATTNSRIGGGIWIQNVSINNCATSTGLLGAGDVFFQNISGYENTTGAVLTSRAMNIAVDGGFENAAVPDDIVAAGDQANTDRLTARNSELSVVSLSGTVEGSKALRHYKVFGNGSTSRIYIAYPIQGGRVTSFRGYLKKPGSSTGNLFYNYYYASGKYQNGAGYTAFRATTSYNPSFAASQTISLASSMPDAVQLTTGQPLTRAPMWATHFLIEIVADSWNSAGESIYYDDFIVTQQ